MHRYDILKEILKDRKFFKLVCGAGNEDIQEVRKLAFVYTLAGAHMLDLSANIDVVRAAKEGVRFAFEIAPKLGKKIRFSPYLNVSIGLKGDPHVRKAKIDLVVCTKCGLCVKKCPQEAIEDFIVKEYKCIGCGECEKVCKFAAISFIHKRVDFSKTLPACVAEGVETMELHAVIEDEEAVFADWGLLNNLIKNNFLSMCLDRQVLSNKNLIERIRKAYEITGKRFIVQADGVPMSGEADDYNTTLQAIACADVVRKSGIPVIILLSGGTNGKTGLLAKQCGIDANGVAVGSWARMIVKEFIKREDFDSNMEIIKKAVSVAEDLIRVNIEALSGALKR
jgi:ferredoxin